MNKEMRQSTVSLTIKDKAILHMAYMPFLENGGLFVPTSESYQIGDEALILLTLMDEVGSIPIVGKVIWITPSGAQGNRQAGIGVQFSWQDAVVSVKIESYLDDVLNDERHTHTM